MRVDMLKKVKTIIKKALATVANDFSISDGYAYPDNEKSFCGNALFASDILFVTNVLEEFDFLRWMQQEKCFAHSLELHTDALSLEKIENSRDHFTGKYDCIVNILKLNESNRLLSLEENYNDNDAISITYKWLQVESDYLLQHKQGTHICTILIHDDVLEQNVIAEALKNCIKGLGKVLGNHGIIINGVIALSEVDSKSILNTVSYLSSKYGQILAGEVLCLKN